MKGWKTWVGTIGYALCTGLAGIFPDWSSVLLTVANTVFAPLGVIGVAHKIEKATG